MPGLQFFFVSFGPFLSSVSLLEEKKWARHPSLASPNILTLLGLQFWTRYFSICTWSRSCSWPPAWAVVFHACVAPAHWLVMLLFPPSQRAMASLNRFHSSSSTRSHPLGKPSLVLPPQACVLPLLPIKRFAECSVSWPPRVTGHSCPIALWLFVCPRYASVSPQARATPFSASSQWYLPRADLIMPGSSLSLLPLFCAFSSPLPGAKKKERGKRSS